MRIEQEQVRIDGLHCLDCVKKIQKRISGLPGVKGITISFATGRIEVEYDRDKARLEQIQSAIRRLGYGILREEIEGESVFSLSNNEFALAFLSGIYLAIGLVVEFATWNPTVIEGIMYHVALSEPFYGLAIVLGGYYPARRAATAILNRSFIIDGLMVAGALGAVLIGAFAEAAAVLFLFSLAELLEDYSVERTRDSLRKLMDLKPKMASVKKNDTFVPTKVEDIGPGDIVRVKPGEQVGVDGIVVTGHSTIDQAPITGESMPVSKGLGDEVFAGTMNQDGRIEVRVTKKSSDSTLSKIIQLVESAGERKSQTSRFIDRFAKYYTPSILAMSATVAIVPTFLLNQPFDVWFYKALLLLLISCPCALAISTPVSMASSITGAARNGVLIKGGVYVERLDEIDTLAFDKTGTLTEGKAIVTEVIPLNGYSRNDVLRIAASLECLSEHPLGLPIVELAKKKGTPLECIESFHSVPGKGVRGRIGDEWFTVGTGRLIGTASKPPAKEGGLVPENRGETVVFVRRENETMGMITLADQVRYSAKEMVANLRTTKKHKLVMLTGDNEAVAKAVAGELEIGEFHSELLPQEKVNVIEGISKSGKKVAMVGDGVNDAPALAAADLGIAMSAAGSDTALEVADIALLSDDLSKIPYLLNLGKKTMRVVRNNIVAAIGIKLLFTILVFPGLVTLWMAVAIGDMGVSLGVILNSLRLAKVR
ncbi:MAG: heavy metal translocating P-type ATPase [Thermoplasmata archaeon]